MRIRFELNSEFADRLCAEAKARGLGLEECARCLAVGVNRHPPTAPGKPIRCGVTCDAECDCGKFRPIAKVANLNIYS